MIRREVPPTICIAPDAAVIEVTDTMTATVCPGDEDTMCEGEPGGWIVVDLVGVAGGAGSCEGKKVAHGDRKLDSPVPVSWVVAPGVGLVVGPGV